MTDQHLFANDGSDWTSTRTPENTREARAADQELDEEVAKGDGFSATNETRLSHTIVEGSESPNAAADANEAEGEEANGA
jgi:hypothetical protein